MPEEDIGSEYCTVLYSDFYWLFACIRKKNYLQVNLDNCAYKIANKQMTDHLDDNLFETDEN